MERSWWWKTLGVVLLAVISTAYLLPSFVPEKSLPSWFSKYIKSKLHLGLDLQGGMHLVYEVEVEKAATDKAKRLAADIERKLKDQSKIKATGVAETKDKEALDDSGLSTKDIDVVLTFDKASDMKALDSKFLADFGSLEEVGRDAGSRTVRLRMSDEYLRSVQDYAIRQAVETIRGRIDEFGPVAEPSILRKGNDIIVELPGLDKKYFERVRKQIGRTAQLEFKMVDDEHDFMRKVSSQVPKDGPIKVRSDSYDGKKNGVVSYTYFESKDKAALQKFIAGLKIPKTHEIVLGEGTARDEKNRKLPDKIWMTYLVKSVTELTGEYITDAQVQFDSQSGRPEVALTFDTEGGRKFADLSGNNVGKRMAIMLDDKVNSAPVFEGRIGGGRARITMGGFRDPIALQNEARDLASVLRTGALPAPLRKTFERQVGPTLGQDAIERGKLAFYVGAGLVILFILFYYRMAGLFCDIALALNFLFIAAIMAGFEATLTLPGIAGLVLTVGMAVDANVIIYERIREEAALGKSPRAAVGAGYGRAFWTIFDAQLTTAIAGIVLLQYGSGPIRGFALTLLIGIVCSMFTSIVVTRLLFDLVIFKFKPKQLSI